MISSQSFLDYFTTKMSPCSLIKLSASTIVQDGCNVKRYDLSTLPRAVLQELLWTSISQSRILSLRTLIVKWPLRQLMLQNVQDFDEPKAVLLAYCLQRFKHDLRLVDIRGCHIGLHGTTAFCKLAADIQVSNNDVLGMKILDTRSTAEFLKGNFPTKVSCQRFPPTVVMLDCIVDKDNCGLVIQACIKHSVMDLKISHLTVHPMRRNKLRTLLSSLESSIIKGLNLAMNGLQEEGFNVISPIITTFTNLTDLNLSYTGITIQNTSAIQQIANICHRLTMLRKFDVSGNYIRSGVYTILRHLQSPLTHLDLRGCGVRESDLHEMCKLDTLKHLQSLKLDGGAFVNCIELLCRFVLKSAGTLEFLSLEDHMFDSSSISPLCQMIKTLPLLKRLSLSYNHFLPDDITTIKDKFPAMDLVYKEWPY